MARRRRRTPARNLGAGAGVRPFRRRATAEADLAGTSLQPTDVSMSLDTGSTLGTRTLGPAAAATSSFGAASLGTTTAGPSGDRSDWMSIGSVSLEEVPGGVDVLPEARDLRVRRRPPERAPEQVAAARVQPASGEAPAEPSPEPVPGLPSPPASGSPAQPAGPGRVDQGPPTAATDPAGARTEAIPSDAPTDSGPPIDGAGSPTDAGPPTDAGSRTDSGPPTAPGSRTDFGPSTDAGPGPHGGPKADSGDVRPAEAVPGRDDAITDAALLPLDAIARSAGAPSPWDGIAVALADERCPVPAFVTPPAVPVPGAWPAPPPSDVAPPMRDERVAAALDEEPPRRGTLDPMPSIQALAMFATGDGDPAPADDLELDGDALEPAILASLDGPDAAEDQLLSLELDAAAASADVDADLGAPAPGAAPTAGPRPAASARVALGDPGPRGAIEGRRVRLVLRDPATGEEPPTVPYFGPRPAPGPTAAPPAPPAPSAPVDEEPPSAPREGEDSIEALVLLDEDGDSIGSLPLDADEPAAEEPVQVELALGRPVPLDRGALAAGVAVAQPTPRPSTTRRLPLDERTTDLVALTRQSGADEERAISPDTADAPPGEGSDDWLDLDQAPPVDKGPKMSPYYEDTVPGWLPDVDGGDTGTRGGPGSDKPPPLAPLDRPPPPALDEPTERLKP